MFHNLREVVEAVVEFTNRWHGTVAIARVVRCYEVKSIRQLRNQIAKHV